MPDWKKLKKEYVTTDISLRQMAKKYGVPFSTLGKRSTAEKWADARIQYGNTVVTKTLEKSSDEQSEYYATKLEIGNQMLQNIKQYIEEAGIEALPMYDKLALTIQRIDGFKGWKTDADLKEQDARIRNLEKQLEAENAQAEPTRIIIEGADDYCN